MKAIITPSPEMRPFSLEELKTTAPEGVYKRDGVKARAVASGKGTYRVVLYVPVGGTDSVQLNGTDGEWYLTDEFATLTISPRGGG